MKLISFLQGGRETWGAVVDHQVFDLGKATDIATLAQFVGSDRFAQRDTLIKGEKPVALYDDIKPTKPIRVVVTFPPGGIGLHNAAGGPRCATSAYNRHPVRPWPSRTTSPQRRASGPR